MAPPVTIPAFERAEPTVDGLTAGIAVRGVLSGASLWHTGQVRVAGTRILTPRSIHDRSVAAAARAASNPPVGTGLA